MKELVLLFALVLMLPVFADIPPLPNPGVWDIPLHRIGLEVVLASIASAVGGGTVMRLLLKRGWKKSDELTPAERDDFAKLIDAAMPTVDDEVKSLCGRMGSGVLELESPSQHSDYSNSLNRVKAAVLSEILLKNKDLRKSLEGVPMELVCERIQLPKESLEDSMWPYAPYLCSREDELEFVEAMRRNYKSPSLVFREENLRRQEAIRQERIRQLKKEIRWKLVLLALAVPLIYLAWKLGQM